jgi:hypothetical protein
MYMTDGIIKTNIKVLDSIAPLRKKKSKRINSCPWLDSELTVAKNYRDYLYHLAIASKLDEDWQAYRQARIQFNYLNRYFA